MKFAILELYDDDTLKLREVVEESGLGRARLNRGVDHRLWEVKLDDKNVRVLRRCIDEAR